MSDCLMITIFSGSFTFNNLAKRHLPIQNRTEILLDINYVVSSLSYCFSNKRSVGHMKQIYILNVSEKLPVNHIHLT